MISTITACSLFLSTYNLFASNTCSLFYSQTIRYSAYNLFVSSNAYSLDMYYEELQTTTETSHTVERILTDCRLLCLALL